MTATEAHGTLKLKKLSDYKVENWGKVKELS